MASVISAGTTSTTALNLSGDTTGVLQLQTNGTTAAMTIDTSQNVGIGATPSAWSAYKGLNIGLNATLAGSTGGSVALLSTNAYFDGSSYKYITTDAATQYQQNTGQHIWRGAASGTAGNTLTFTQILALERTKSLALEGASSQSGTGITFPATQSASTNANTLDDYEEGTWSPNKGSGITDVGTLSSEGTYVKIGKVVTVTGSITSTGTVAVVTTGAICSNLPFTSENTGRAGMGGITNNSINTANTTWMNVNSTTLYATEAVAATVKIWFTVTYFV